MTLRPARRMEGVERTLIRRIFDAAPPDAINLGLGQPDLPTPARIALAGISAIARGRTGYTSTAGDPALRSEIARRYAPHADGPDNVVVTVGSQEAMFAAVMALVDPGDEVLYPDPGYPAYPVVTRLVGGTPVAYPLRAERGFHLDVDDIASRLTERTRAVILCSPSNPTGAVDRDEDLERLAEILEAREVAWISDEIYAGFCYVGTPPSIRSFAPDGGLTLSGVSKDLSMTGWRIGWIVGPSRIVGRIISAHQYLVTCASSVSQEAALAAMAPESDDDRRRYLELFRARRDLMARELSGVPKLRFALPEGAFYFFVDVSSYGESSEIARRILERRRVITIPGEAFGANGAGFLRISYAASEADIVRGIGAIREELAV